MSDYLVPKYLYKASDFINPKSINRDIAKIMNGVTITNSDNLEDVLKSADQIQSTTTDYLNAVIPESQTQQPATTSSNIATTTTTDSQISQCSLQQLVQANPQITNLVNVFLYVKNLYSTLQSVMNYIYNGGLLTSNSIASSLSTSNNNLCSSYNANQNYITSDSSYLSAYYPYSFYNSSNLENVVGSSNCCCNSSSSFNQYYFAGNSPIYANSAQAGQLFSITNSDYVNNYLLAPPNIV